MIEITFRGQRIDNKEWVYVLPACGVGTPHKRERVWFIAHTRKELLNAIKPENRSVENIGRGQKEWRENWNEFKLGTPIGNTTSNFYNGKHFEPTIIRINDGVSSQLDELEAYGNAIVPQVALQIFKAIEQYESLTTPSTGDKETDK